MTEQGIAGQLESLASAKSQHDNSRLKLRIMRPRPRSDWIRPLALGLIRVVCLSAFRYSLTAVKEISSSPHPPIHQVNSCPAFFIASKHDLNRAHGIIISSEIVSRRQSFL